MRLTVWLFLVLLFAGAVAAGHAEDFDELLQDTKFKKLMLQSNGMLMVLDGILVNESNHPVVDQRVKLYCEHEGKERRIFTVITDENGHFFAYKLNMQPWRCAVGDIVWGEYTASPKHRTNSFIVQNQMTQGVPYMGIVGVPEFSTVTLALTIIGVLAGLVILRK